MRCIKIEIFLFVVVANWQDSHGYIVDGIYGHDDNTGQDIASAFKTINRCVQELKYAGDECQVRAGRYHEVVTLAGLRGTADSPIKIVGYQEERPIWDGTVNINPMLFSRCRCTSFTVYTDIPIQFARFICKFH